MDSNQAEKKSGPSAPPRVSVRIEKGTAEKTDFHFAEAFRIGRSKDCEVRITDRVVSRFHAEILFVGGTWWIYDLNSGNGTYVDGKRIERARLENDTTIQLGPADAGPLLSLTIEEISREGVSQPEHSETHYMRHYFGDSGKDGAGQHTMMVRRAFKKVQKTQKRKYAGIIAVVACLFLAAGTYAVFKHIEVRKQRLLAQDIFYAMKSLELEFAGLLKEARLSKDPRARERVSKYMARRKEMEQTYDQFMNALKVYGESISEEERIILRTARAFGECEINVPEGFVEEVMKYIKKWKSTQRLKNAVHRAKKNGYVTKIAETMLAHDLPPQFFYLALQESNFDLNACGPKTKYGIAKGMWQFIPSTGVFYGLRTGPLVHLRRPDPRDQRHDFGMSTLAAARYLRDIYDTEAQASGLLVAASYNWGQRRVIELIRKMPENPRERNFWSLLANYKDKIPRETYDYVYYIISAAVIGQNPRLFGFDFDSPLDSN